MEGWIQLHRQIRDHWIWNDPIKLRWWLDILLTVNHADTQVNVGMNLVECKRGQSVRSLLGWATRWGVSKDTVRSFFKLLLNDSMITTENLTKTTRLTVCNYDTYQGIKHDEQTITVRQPYDNRPQTDPNNNDNNEKKEIKDINRFKFKQSLIELGVSEQIASDWIQVRKNKKAANTQTAFNSIKKEIELSGLHPEECIKMAVERSWQGFKAEWAKNHLKTNKYGFEEQQQSGDSRKAAIMREAAAACATSSDGGHL